MYITKRNRLTDIQSEPVGEERVEVQDKGMVLRGINTNFCV